MWPADIEVKAGEIIAELTARGLKVATAESCTGGLIAGALTEISGSSAVVDRGFVTYSNEAKVAMLGVEEATLAAHGAVSRQTAIEMVEGAVRHSAADFAVAVTGIAGPSGGSAEKPVGLVHLAASGRNGEMLHREMRYGDIGRSGIRLATVRTALDMLAEIAQIA
ncbi:CinA family protein [Ensifer sesbaniae]|jgi:nicotinamide-nucleotide amidase|uniref:CinA family protein n=1 Tax=Ensifer sesbaniae TaxID=1214071 RepID=UPI0015688E01|nr:CinA family protein [Ensifer sesbaniae]MCK3777728.1 CinA family protein [Ensifer sesbaniae]NRQ14481.1 Nicotinamide-nucleotide amidohydrolase PncC [Ensifer sesbaniae]